EDAAAQILAGHVEERVCRLQHGDVDKVDATLFEQRHHFIGKGRRTHASPDVTFCIRSLRLPNGS
ncbi:hypothetical protein Q6316_28745, partial [Klebsiella pneumoniae]|nr:hypothetical protein [Klebsiella pneumoniae]